jgi:hypothetical protein
MHGAITSKNLKRYLLSLRQFKSKNLHQKKKNLGKSKLKKLRKLNLLQKVKRRNPSRNLRKR